MRYRFTSLTALLLGATGCNTVDLADVHQDIQVWVRQGYTPGEMVYVTLHRDAGSEADCPDIGVEASIAGVSMTLADEGGWVDPLLGDANCQATTFVLSAEELAELGGGEATLRIEDSSYTITIELPTLLVDRALQVVEPADGQLVAGHAGRIVMGAPADQVSYLDAWIIRAEGSMSCPAVDSFGGVSFTNNELSFTVPADAYCPETTMAELVVKGEWDLCIGAVAGLERSQVAGVSYVSTTLPLRPAAQ